MKINHIIATPKLADIIAGNGIPKGTDLWVTEMFTDEINMCYAQDIKDAYYFKPVEYEEYCTQKKAQAKQS